MLHQVPDQFKLRVPPPGVRIRGPKTIDRIVVILNGPVQYLLARKQPSQSQIYRPFLGRALPQADEVGFRFRGPSGVPQGARQAELIIKVIAGVAERRSKIAHRAFRLSRALRQDAAFVEMAGQSLLLFMKAGNQAIDSQKRQYRDHHQPSDDHGRLSGEGLQTRDVHDWAGSIIGEDDFYFRSIEARKVRSAAADTTNHEWLRLIHTTSSSSVARSGVAQFEISPLTQASPNGLQAVKDRRERITASPLRGRCAPAYGTESQGDVGERDRSSRHQTFARMARGGAIR